MSSYHGWLCLALAGALTWVIPSPSHAQNLGRDRYLQRLALDDQPKDAIAPPTAPPVPAPKQLKITVVAVTGSVQVKQAADQPWQAAKVGMQLNPGADLRTALRSTVQIKIEPGQTITLDRLGTIKVIEAVQQGAKVKTDIGLPYGRASYDIKTEQEQHDAKVHTPGTIMAIRGTFTVSQSDALTERTTFVRGYGTNLDKMTLQRVDINAYGVATVTSSTITPAANSVQQTENNSRGEFAGLTKNELALLVKDPSDQFGFRDLGLESFSQVSKQENFESTVGTGLSSSVGSVEVVEGTLAIILNWNGAFVDLDLAVQDPFGDVLDQNLESVLVRVGTSTQGTHPSNDPGNSIGGGEQVNYQPNHGNGEYRVSVSHQTGSTASAALAVSKGGVAFGPPVGFTVNPSDPPSLFIVDTRTNTITPVAP